MKVAQRLGAGGLNFVGRVGCAGLFLLKALGSRGSVGRLRRVMQQVYFCGVLSLIIIAVSGLFIGMVIALQGQHTLVNFSAEAQLGQLVALSIVRELGPVVTALLFAGRVGSALTAEIGLMQATEQIGSMEMMAVDPLSHVIWPRLVAGFITLPMLTVIFNAVAILGGYWVAVHWLGLNASTFWSNMQAAVDLNTDVLNGLIKSVVFGFAVAWVSTYQGYFSVPTAEGIGEASTRTVVYSSLWVLGLDFMLTAMMLGSW